MHKTILLFPSFFLLHLCLCGQNASLSFRNINRSSGLPADEVTTLAQDSNGFIWAGTPEGLYRYDGFSFKNFTPANPAFNSGSFITKIIVDRTSRLWVGSLDGGMTVLDGNGKHLRTINATTSAIVSKAAEFVTDVLQDREGNVWWTTVDGLFRSYANSNKIDCYKTPSKRIRANAYNRLCLDGQGRLWVGAVNGLYVFNVAKKSFVAAGDDAAQKAFYSGKIDFSAIAFQGSKFWYSNWSPQLGLYDHNTHTTKTFYSGVGSRQPDYAKMANTIFVDSRGAVWAGTGSGLLLARSDAENLISFHHDAQNDFSLANDWVNAVLEDREGNFWFGTKRGISIARPYNQSVINISGEKREVFSFKGKEVTDIIEADINTLLVGTQNADGLYITDGQFRPVKRIAFNDVGFDWIWHHYHDRPINRIFISTQEGMLVYDKKTSLVAKAKDSILQKFFPVSSFVATSDSILWMTRFRNQLLRYNLRSGDWKIIDLTKLGEKQQVLYLTKDNNNQLWIQAHNTGLLRFNEKTETITERLVVEDNKGLKHSGISSFIDIGESYFIGYLSKGISLYHKATKTFRHFTTREGLASNSVRAALRVADGTLWIATKGGISHFFPATGRFQNYTYENGVLHSDFNCITRLSDGRIAAGSTQGLVYLAPEELKEHNTALPPLVTEVNVYGKELSPAMGQVVEVGYAENYFSFEYISLHYSSRQQAEYAYKLEGLNKDWVPAGNRRFVSYSGVPGGRYTFRVRARLPNGVWVENREPVRLQVQTAFYKQWWFFVLAAIGAIAVVYFVFRYRLQQALKVERMRSSISSDLHDEVGATLTSISFFSETARKLVQPLSKEEEFLTRIGERSRESIEKMSDIIWSIKPDNDSLEQMLVRMKGYASEVTEASNAIVHWTESGNLNTSRLSMEQRKNIYLLFKEAINNSMKHAGAAHVWVNLTAASNQMVMTITDDGKGFDHLRANSGNGIKNMHRRAAALKGNLHINSSPEEGTSVRLQFRY